MKITADHVHWGCAAYIFSLDLSEGLAILAVPDCPWSAVRAAVRTAIIENRKSVQSGGNPLVLRDAIGRAINTVGEAGVDISGADHFFEWVDTRLVTAGRPRNRRVPLLNPLRDLFLLAKVDAELGLVCFENRSYAAHVHSTIDHNNSEILLRTVFSVDERIDLKMLSDWDRDIIARNINTHSPESPLAPLIYSLSQALLIDAAEQVAHKIGPDHAQILHDLCSAEGRS